VHCRSDEYAGIIGTGRGKRGLRTQNHSLIDIYHAGFHGGADNFVRHDMFAEMAPGYFSTN
jgi:hypothetical protein